MSHTVGAIIVMGSVIGVYVGVILLIIHQTK